MDKTPLDKTPPVKTPQTKPPGQNLPDKTPRTKPPRTNPPPPDKIYPPDKPPLPSQNMQTKPLTKRPEHKPLRKTTQNKLQILNKAHRGQKPGKIQDGFHFKFRWLQSSIINMMNGKLYVYIQLQMRYLIATWQHIDEEVVYGGLAIG